MSPADRHRKMLRRYHMPGGIYLVTATTRRRQPLLTGAAADVTVRAFERIGEEQRALAMAYVVMPDHVHAVVQPRHGATIGEVVKFFKRVSGNAIRKLGHTGRTWEARFYDRVIRGDLELTNAIRYTHWNPVKAGLCEDPEDWPWSSAFDGATEDSGSAFDSRS